ncbi:uncharacterized protein LOC134836599 [Culicoides brevitarsis]|uniref:uncharacterized protein LOC134836599 n=1 Tax=Culicoides brevitarsis TaxID=469753 RepID=UPI00307CAA2F
MDSDEWVWDFDADDEESSEYSFDRPEYVPESRVQKIDVEKMRIIETTEDRRLSKVKLNEEEELIEDLRVLNIGYLCNEAPKDHKFIKRWENENKEAVVAQGIVPVFVGPKYFDVSMWNGRKSKKSKSRKKDKNPFRQSLVEKDINPFRNLPVETNPFRDKSIEKLPEKGRRPSVAEQILQSVKNQQKIKKKKSFKKFQGDLNFNPEVTGPTIGPEGHKFDEIRKSRNPFVVR